MKQNHGLVFNIQLVAGGLTLPIAGWLADIYFGRYKMINLSMWIMWISVMLATTCSIVTEMVGSYRYDSINRYVSATLAITGVIGNIISVLHYIACFLSISNIRPYKITYLILIPALGYMVRVLRVVLN